MDNQELETMRFSFEKMNQRRLKNQSNSKIIKQREKVKKIRQYSIENMDSLIDLAKTNLEMNGIECFYAENSDDACELIYDVVKDEDVVVKAKSNTLREINLNSFLDNKNIQLIETDLGDRILQLNPSNRKPSHPTGPISHFNIKRIQKIIFDKFGEELSDNPFEIMKYVRSNVLNNIKKSNIGITGANAIAAEDGSLIMVHNEGNISLLSLKDTHIIVAGIDKIVNTIEEAMTVVKLETMYATGTNVTSYINVISAPSKTADIEKKLLKGMYGAKRVILILLDNGRSNALDECLLCIGCGSCLISCPVYNTVGNDFGYKGYLGGRGVAISNFLENGKISKDSGLYMCTLCGLCVLECPVSTPTPEIIEKIRTNVNNLGEQLDVHNRIKENIKSTGKPFEKH